MNTHTFHATVAAATLVMMAGCGTAVSDEAKEPRKAQAQVDAGATYDGWEVRLRHGSVPPTCAFSPDQVQRLREAGRPLPSCVQRQQRWFRDHYPASDGRSGPTGRR